MRFNDNIHTALWGTENWVCSARQDSPSVVAAGMYAGQTLDSMEPKFPLLMKVIDAKTRLSVQVHPNETTCLVTGGEPKSEMWCALSDGPIYAGLNPGTTARQIEKAVQSGDFENLLVRHEAKAGDVFYIPGGLVHAIGDGVRLYEVQQSSNTTFRLYDWGRVGVDGKPRKLHVAEALKAIDYSLPVPKPVKSLDTPFFKFRQEFVSVERTFVAPDGNYLSIFSERFGNVLLRPGEKFKLVPTLGGENLMITQFEKRS